VHYPGNSGTSTPKLITIKLLINTTISTEGAKIMTMDIKDFYLNTPMAGYEYMQLKLSDIPANVIEHYKFNDIATPDGYANPFGGKLLKPGNPYFGPTDQLTNHRLTAEELKYSRNRARRR
jgi:hypothetical protein